MIDSSVVARLVDAVRRYLVGVVTLTRQVLFGFVSAVFAGVGVGLVAGMVVALIAALGIAGLKMRTDDVHPETDDRLIIDITPSAS
jgi:hypothetical protein